MRKARAGQRHLNPQSFSGNYASLRAQGMDQPGTTRTPQEPLPKPPQQRRKTPRRALRHGPSQQRPPQQRGLGLLSVLRPCIGQSEGLHVTTGYWNSRSNQPEKHSRTTVRS